MSSPEGKRRDSPLLTSRAYYDAVAEEYDDMLAGRACYVGAVNDLVVKWSQERGARTLLDVGCGNGARLLDILHRTQLRGTGVDESPRMVAEAARRGLPARVMDISAPLPVTPGDDRYDLIIALWNVFGHIAGPDGRLRALRNMRALLAAGGAVVFDVNNRYNARQYGWPRVVRNVMRDLVTGGRSGDFVTRRAGRSGVHETSSHVFTRSELLALCRDAGLRPLVVQPVDYQHGMLVSGQWQGQFVVLAEPSSERVAS